MRRSVEATATPGSTRRSSIASHTPASARARPDSADTRARLMTLLADEKARADKNEREIDMLKRQLTESEARLSGVTRGEKRAADNDAVRVERLKRQRRYLMEQAQRSRSETSSDDQIDTRVVADLKHEIVQLRDTCARMRTEVTQANESLALKRDVERECQQYKTRLALSDARVAELEQRNKALSRSERELVESRELNSCLKHDLDLSRARVSELEQLGESRGLAPDSSVSDHLAKELRYFRAMESRYKEAIGASDRARELSRDLVIAEEKVVELSAQLDKSRVSLREFETLKNENETLRSERERWSEILNSVGGETNAFSSAKQVADHLTELQKERQLAAVQIGELRAKTEGSDERVASEVAARELVERQLSKAHATIDTLSAAVKRESTRARALDTEVVGLRRLLDSYTKEQSAMVVGRDDYESQNAKRIEELEKALALRDEQMREANAQYEALEKDWQERLESRDVLPSVREALDELSLNLRRENTRLKAELEKLLAEAGTFDSRLGRGDYNVETTKVLHMVDNPTTFARAAAMDALREENDELRTRVNEFERASESQGGGVELVAERQKASELQARLTEAEKSHKETVSQIELRLTRMREVFQKAVRNFREVVYLALGYKVEMVQEGGNDVTTFKLSPTFATSPADHLLFKCKTGGIELLENSYSRRLNPKLIAVLQESQSIPVFLAQLTRVLFQRQKGGGSSSSGGAASVY